MKVFCKQEKRCLISKTSYTALFYISENVWHSQNARHPPFGKSDSTAWKNSTPNQTDVKQWEKKHKEQRKQVAVFFLTVINANLHATSWMLLKDKSKITEWLGFHWIFYMPFLGHYLSTWRLMSLMTFMMKSKDLCTTPVSRHKHFQNEYFCWSRLRWLKARTLFSK